MSLGQLGQPTGTEPIGREIMNRFRRRQPVGHSCIDERDRLFARLRTVIVPGLEELVDPAATPAELIAIAERQSRLLRRELERPAGETGGLSIAGVDDPACAEESEWVRGHLHDTALQILEFIAGDGFGTGLSSQKIARLAGGAARDLRRWLDAVDEDPTAELLPELELIADEARELERDVELVVGPGGAPLTVRQVEALAGAVREAVTNARKHARAQNVVVRVECDADGRTSVTVADDGIGIDLEQARRATGLGLRRSILGRMERVGGHASLDSAPGGGTLVTLTTSAAGS